MKLLVYGLLLLLICSCQTRQEGRSTVKIGFGSCLQRGGGELFLWDALQRESFDLFVFAGDNVYADPRDIEELQQNYLLLKANRGFADFFRTTDVVAVYDDHDYGLNDSGGENPLKQQAALACLDFFNVPDNHPRRQHEGIYGDYFVQQDNLKVQVVLLDTRYFRSVLVKSKDRGLKYAANDSEMATMLGDKQWQWFEGVLQKKADLRIIVSTIQFIADKRGQESWGNFPKERVRMLDLLSAAGDGPVIFFSGDAHFAELSKLDYKGQTYYDFTSSALFHPHNTKDGRPTRFSQFPNEYRVPGSGFTAGNFGFVQLMDNGVDRELTLTLCQNNGKKIFEHLIKLKSK